MENLDLIVGVLAVSVLALVVMNVVAVTTLREQNRDLEASRASELTLIGLVEARTEESRMLLAAADEPLCKPEWSIVLRDGGAGEFDVWVDDSIHPSEPGVASFVAGTGPTVATAYHLAERELLALAHVCRSRAAAERRRRLEAMNEVVQP